MESGAPGGHTVSAPGPVAEEPGAPAGTATSLSKRARGSKPSSNLPGTHFGPPYWVTRRNSRDPGREKETKCRIELCIYCKPCDLSPPGLATAADFASVAEWSSAPATQSRVRRGARTSVKNSVRTLTASTSTSTVYLPPSAGSPNTAAVSTVALSLNPSECRVTLVRHWLPTVSHQ